ncbi:MAG: GNAT family N-acetyltransferase [Lachnospiraceae bacterium]|nr:GNAT family N-acetyltransferase [Lachnospiraceae bacterium]
MDILVFKDITLEYRDAWNRCIAQENVRSCDYAFANCFIWADEYNAKIASFGGCMIIFWEDENRKRYYSFPVGGSDEEKMALFRSLQDLEEEPVFSSVTQEQVQWLQTHFPGEYEAIPYRDGFDYVYDTETLAELKGGHFAGKRNHIKHFTEGGTWSFRELEEDDIQTCLALEDHWINNKLESGEDEPDSLEAERHALMKALDYRKELGIQGFVLEQNGAVVAFVLASPQTKDQVTVHFEKASGDVRGAYQMINREFARRMKDRFAVINREDDAGNPGLRFAKSSYHGYRLIRNYYVYYGHYAFAGEMDRDETVNLYLSAFDDPRRLAEFFVDRHRILKLFVQGRAVCQAALIPCSIMNGGKTVPAIYLYALSTDLRQRGKGFATELTEHITERNRCPLITVPESEGLVPFYEKLGFKSFCSSPEKRIERGASECRITAEDITQKERKYIMKHLLLCRKRFCELEGDVVWDEEALSYALEDHMMADGRIAALSDGGMIWYIKNGNGLELSTVMDEPDKETEAVRALLEAEEAKTAHIPAMKVLIRGYNGKAGRMDMTLS